MNYHNKIFSLFFLLALSLPMLLLITACSSGPVAKQPDSISSPAQQQDSGVYQYNNNNYPEAIAHFEKALLQYRSIDDRRGIAISCMNLAKTYMAINNNLTASQYLYKANEIILHEALPKLNEHLHLLNSSLAINNQLYPQALTELAPVLNSTDPVIQLAALKNRSSIAFNRNDIDKEHWLNKYTALQQKNPTGTSSHRARILRFQADLNTDENSKIKLLDESLNLSRKLADRTAIAACLSQWAAIDSKAARYDAAEDKYLRALFIRHQLGDVKSSLNVLQNLKTIYSATSADQQLQLTESWINKLSTKQFDDWEQLFSDYESFPQTL